MRENKKFLKELKESLLIITDKLSLVRNTTTLFLLNGIFYFVMCKCMSKTVCVNDTV